MDGVILIDFLCTLKAFLTGAALLTGKDVMNSTEKNLTITTNINSNEAFNLRHISPQ